MYVYVCILVANVLCCLGCCCCHIPLISHVSRRTLICHGSCLLFFCCCCCFFSFFFYLLLPLGVSYWNKFSMNAPIRWAFHFHACHLQQQLWQRSPRTSVGHTLCPFSPSFSLPLSGSLLPCCSLLLPQCVVARCKSETFANLGSGTHKIHTHAHTHIIFGPRISQGKAKHTHTHTQSCTCMLDKHIDI